MEESIPHSPAPQQSRGIYGFVFFITWNLLIFFYFIWIILPTEWTRTLPYEPPQIYWAAALPIYFCTCLFFFAFCIYPALHSRHDGELDDQNSITDNFSLPKSQHDQDQEEKKVNMERIVLPASTSFTNMRIPFSSNSKKSSKKDSIQAQIPQISDLDLIDVCKILYAKKKKS